jgi:transposase-like protein
LNCHSHGVRRNKKRYECQECKAWFSVDLSEEVKKNLNMPVIGVMDIESLPAIVYTWGLFDQNIGINQIITDSCMLSWAGKILNSSEIYSDIMTPKETKTRDTKRITLSAFEFMKKCQIIIGHNFKNFDSKIINVCLLEHAKPLKYQIIDSLEIARNNFRFSSNKLAFINKKLGIREKIDNEGFPLWQACSNGDKTALDTMLNYNIGDIHSTEDLYYRLRSFMGNHPNLAKYNTIETEQCPVCLSEDLVEEGVYYTNQYESLRCNNCGALSRRKLNLFSKEKKKSLLVK